ncbi:MAG: pilus assembly protein N-terminal domain-containing protein, partial [Candidatus Omnitrophica bacterium]|nr:pilus assembly protein N-terminal domain-containing protein [Candidatus Omnitrophota bacterium]
MKKCLVFLIIISFISLNIPAFAYYPQVSAYLCELGIQFYNNGDFAQALHEFNKALLADPNNPLALEYIQRIEKKSIPPEEIISPPPKIHLPEVPSYRRQDIISKDLDAIERELALPKELTAVEKVPWEIAPPQIIALNENIKTLRMPIQIEQGKTIIINGNGISRFLIITPNVLSAERKSNDELIVTGKDFGHTYMHIWDKNGRWTLEYLTVYPEPEGPTLEELQWLEEERASTFKLRYYFDWASFESGRRINYLNRLFYQYTHGLSLDGPIPYGDIDSRITVRSLANTTDLTYFTLGLRNGRFRQFRDFSLRLFDFSTDSSRLVSPITSLRGVKFNSPAFNKKIDYTLFWGREGGGRFGNLSPGLSETKDSFLSGLNLSVSPTQKFNQKFSIIRGWGNDRPADLNEYGYDLETTYN